MKPQEQKAEFIQLRAEGKSYAAISKALKSEYIDTTPAPALGNNFEAKDIMGALGNLLDRIRAGEVTNKQAARENLVFGNLLKTYDAVELKAKLEALEAIVGGRG